jgi:hypothetical protein
MNYNDIKVIFETLTRRLWRLFFFAFKILLCFFLLCWIGVQKRQTSVSIQVVILTVTDNHG